MYSEALNHLAEMLQSQRFQGSLLIKVYQAHIKDPGLNAMAGGLTG